MHGTRLPLALTACPTHPTLSFPSHPLPAPPIQHLLLPVATSTSRASPAPAGPRTHTRTHTRARTHTHTHTRTNTHTLIRLTSAGWAEVEGLGAHGGERGGGVDEERLVAGGEEDEAAGLCGLYAEEDETGTRTDTKQ